MEGWSIPNPDCAAAKFRSSSEGAQGRSEGESREGGANLTPKTCAVRHQPCHNTSIDLELLLLIVSLISALA